MEKQRKWQLFLILAVIGLTLYNILPTLLYYFKPLKEPITNGQEIIVSIEKRINQLEAESKDWLGSFCELIHVKPLYIELDTQNPQHILVRFAKTDEAARFRKFLPRAGSLIPFAPAQLALAPQEEDGKEVLVQRKIPLHFDTEHPYFSFAAKGDPLFRQLILDRAAQVAFALCGPQEPALLLTALQEHPQLKQNILESLASQIDTIAAFHAEKPSIAKRFATTFTQGDLADRKEAIQMFLSSFDALRDEIKKQKAALLEKEKSDPSDEQQQALRLLEKKESNLLAASNFLKKQQTSFAAGQDPWTITQIKALLDQSTAPLQSLSLGNRNSLFSELVIDWAHNTILLKLHPEILSFKQTTKNKELLEQLLINQAAKITRFTNETVKPEIEEYSISLQNLPEVNGYLVLNLEQVARTQAEQITAVLKNQWNPEHPDLKSLSLVDYAHYQALSPEQKSLSLIVYAPSEVASLPGLRNNSIYVIAKGIDRILQNYEQYPESDPAKIFAADFRKLAEMLRQNGFVGYRGSNLAGQNELTADYIFERNDYYQPLLAATREDFRVHGTQKYALLELSNVEQRILTENKIETSIHEDLLKWNDEYLAAQVNVNPALRYDVPKPTRSLFWSNVNLSMRKLIRGDERKIIRWGLDLSGGKTVQIELRDANNRVVKNEIDLKQGINELYNRVNKMGVSEVSIRQVGNNIVLDFPGSQSLSASELIKASSMYFHVVNEKFSPYNPSLSDSVNRFLQEVWNEAVVTNRKDPQSVNAIAWKHLYGDPANGGHVYSEAARTLLESGLQLQSPTDLSMTGSVDTAISKIAIWRGADFNEWQGQAHPLLIVFRNYALEGSQLENIRSSYDPSKGNFLSFEVQGSTQNREGQKINPRNDLNAWTSRFSREKVLGTPSEAYSQGRGWRMAVLLNDSIISAPTLDSALRDSAMITGNFSQREVNQLVSDLKAGSMTFTPHILSEKNVSPELGQKDRNQGIMATVIAFLLVIISMVGYYRFAGLVASVAVFFNLLILWATLQNIGATLSLAGIAGIILTVGMAVDANVLVFERVKEEFAVTKRISSAIAAGYKKAFSAIVDSNVTTIIAALILLNFDAGPIKGFAITIIIGIASSMFTALFMTRFYFTGWVQNPKNQALKMGDWIHAKKINFLKYAKLSFAIAIAIIAAGGYLIYAQKPTILGMDFTGGFSLNVELEPTAAGGYNTAVEKALLEKGASNRDFQIRELNPANQLRILFGTSMEQKGKPFYNLPIENEKTGVTYSYEKNPRIEWVVDALRSAHIAIAPQSLEHLDANWTAMSGQMSDSMRNNALLGLLASFICIFIYIAFRFEYKFAAAAILCLLHDVLVTLGLVGLLYACGVPVQIDLNTVAAVMMIVGYSLNDTIIIFDRIREEMRQTRNKHLPDIVNSALNATLSRTTITSGTTLLVLVALVALGGSSIFSFALVMTIGVFFGTLSSWYIASPLMLFFHGREEAKDTELVEQA